MFSFDTVKADAPHGAFCYLSGTQIAFLVALLPYTYRVFDQQTDETDALVDATIDAVQGGGMVGQIIWAATETAPAGTLLCNGATYQRNDYPQLWAVIASTLKDETTFTVPNLMGVTVRGGVVGVTGGNDSVTINESNMPNHTHSIGGAVTALALAPGELPVLAPSVLPGVTGGAGGGLPINVTNAFVGLMPCIVVR